MKRSFHLGGFAFSLLLIATAAHAGESPLSASPQATDPQLKACDTRIGLAMNGLVEMRADDTVKQKVYRELQLARSSYNDAHAQACMTHVANAEAMEH